MMTSAARMMNEINAEDWGPGPRPPEPPPVFNLPPPPLPPFMLADLDKEAAETTICQNVLDSHLAVCDMNFPSIKSTSSSSGLADRLWLTLVLAAVGLLFLGLCAAIFLAWKRWRSRNHLSYLRAKSHYDTHQPEASEHPLIYDDANIHFYRTQGNSGSYLSACSSRPTMVRDMSGLSQQSAAEARLLYNGYNSQGDGESRIYEEVFLTEDPYSRPIPPSSTSMGCNSIKKIVTQSNGVDSDQWPTRIVQQPTYSAVYNPAASICNNLVESSFSTATTSTASHQPPSGSSLSATSSHGFERKKKSCRSHRRSQRTNTISSSSCSCSSCSSCPEDNASLMRPHKETSKYCPQPPPPPTASDLLWQGVGMQNNLVSDSRWIQPTPDTQSRQTWHKNVVVQQQRLQKGQKAEDSSGLFSSLWKKRRSQSQQRNVTGNQAWMTLRVPSTTQDNSMHCMMLPPPPSQPLQPLPAAMPLGPMMTMQSKTLGRAMLSNNNTANGHIVMPNPDDILPKEAWTDFSGNDEWPRFSGILEAEANRASGSNNNRLYANCSDEVHQREASRCAAGDTDNNNENFSQQIENNLTEAAAEAGSQADKKAGNSQEWKSRKPVPPPRNCISHQRKSRTKKQQSKGNGAEAASTRGYDQTSSQEDEAEDAQRGGHANDETSSSSDEENDLLLQHQENQEWHQSPLLQ